MLPIRMYRTAQNFGGRKLWRISSESPKFYPPNSGFQNHYSSNRQNFIRQLFHIIESAKVFSRQSFVLYGILAVISDI